MNHVSLSGVITEIIPVNIKGRFEERITAVNVEVYTVLRDDKFKITTIRCFGKGKIYSLLKKIKKRIPLYVVINGRLGTYIERGYPKLGVVIDELRELEEEIKDIQNRGLVEASITLNENITNSDNCENNGKEKKNEN